MPFTEKRSTMFSLKRSGRCRRGSLFLLVIFLALTPACKRGKSPEYKAAIAKLKEAQEWSTSGYMVGEDWDEAVRLLKLVPEDNEKEQKRVKAYLKAIEESRQEWRAKQKQTAASSKKATAQGAALSAVHEKKKAYVRKDRRGKPGRVEWVVKKQGRKTVRSCVRHWSSGVTEVVANALCASP